MLIVIAAMSTNRVIGNKGKLPWYCPEELEHFKRTTSGHPVVMGRKTFESIGRALPGRHNIVVTRDKNFSAEGVEVVHSIDEAVKAAELSLKYTGFTFVIGGEEIYKLALPAADMVMLSIIPVKAEGDTHFPELGEEWKLMRVKDVPAFTLQVFHRI